ncbi:RhoGAP-domain-containing protein [Pisolithus orientalis]|uniref:RhoGAP-domain-containing protein n=1 Tax=Pisolithus orientalis TaxID=936130 RepID=UPI002224CD02|nr:RhoGAP-domain-containing protein [Pisolithus orientalis]KAI6010918.1 RhoGAP-domain-containing protein [Pisolithus orientalis]
MGDDAYPARKSTADHSDSSNPADGVTSLGHHSVIQEGVTSPTLTQVSLKPSSPPPRSSLDSPVRSPVSRHRESIPLTVERRDTLSTIPSDVVSLVEPSFDENVLRALCELDCGVPLLLDRIKQSLVSCREASAFFKKRAGLEEEYGKSLQKLARSTSEVYSMNDGKAGSFVTAWQSSMRLHELMAENRIRFAHRLNEMSEELASLAKEVDKNRKQTKELASRYERALQEAEINMEKSKARLDVSSEELERVLLQKEGESFSESAVQAKPGVLGSKRVLGKAVAKGGLLLKGKNPNILRQEDDIRLRVSNASDSYRKALHDTQAMRQEYFNFQLPRILRALKECVDEIDLGTKYHLTRYAFLFESIVLSDGSTLVPIAPEEEGAGLKALYDAIDNRVDFKTYMQNYAYARGGAARGPRREGPAEEGFLPPLPTHNASYAAAQPPQSVVNGNTQITDRGRPTFGVDLAEQMARDQVELPPVLEKCCAAIEKYGIRSQGIYRISGMARRVGMLKERLDKDMNSVDLDSEEWTTDINNVTSVLKMWFRELPEPVLTFNLHQGFVDAAKIENDRLRHIRLHERVNDLPDPNYATLKYFMGHLHKIARYEGDNSMSIQNLAIVFGPTLFGQVGNGSTSGHANVTMADAPYQNRAIETILEHYTDIFVDESEVTT